MTTVLSFDAIGAPKVEQGILNCVDWDFKNQPYLDLEGEWEFYWKQLISPEEFRKSEITRKRVYASFPELWTNLTIQGEELTAKGYATYRMVIKNDTLLPLMAIEMRDVYTAYKLWVNGELIAQNGEVGKSRVSSTPYWLPLTRTLDLNGKSNEIVLQISNFHHSKGGINKTPVFGTSETLILKREKELTYVYLLTGSLLMGGLFFLGLFLYGKQDRAVLYFSMFCMVYGLRVMGTDLYALHNLIDLPWSVTTAFEYLSLYAIAIFFLEFVYNLYPKESYKPVIRGFQILSLLLALFTIIFPASIYTLVVEFYLLAVALFILYGAYIFIRAAIRQREGTVYALLSTLILFAVMLLNIGAYFGVLPFLPFVYFVGYILFFFLQSLILSFRFASTFKRATEAAESGARVKSEFLATMSHEIRTPMNGIIGMTTLMAQTEMTEEQENYIETIRVSGESLITIINEILDFSKIESGKMDLEEQPFELEVAIEEVLDLLSVKANSKKLNLWYKISRDIPVLVAGDVTRLKQILINLIGNAIKFTEEGEVYIEANIVETANDVLTLEFKIKDTGIGIPKEKQDLLFTKFTQVDASTTRKYGGTGLGLAISQKLVELMGGSISVDSEEGKGATFKFSIALKPTNNKPDRLFYQDEMPVMKGKNVLLIADAPNLIEIISYQTEFWGANIKIAQNISATLQALSEEYDLILIYERLRGVSGMALEKRIRFTAQGKEVPILLLSTSHFESSKQADVHLYTSFVNNPIKTSNLRHNIKNLVLPEGKAAEYRRILKKETEVLSHKLPLKILVAEDHPINQRLILYLLKKQGYQATAVSNGEEAVEILEQQSFDILFMDVQMPVMDGLQATKEIVKKRPNLPERPVIIAMTANAMQGDRERCILAGMDDYLSKPLKPGIVVETLTKWGTRLNKTVKE